jgi:hypothetical protein
VLIPESGAPVLGVVALCGAVGVLVVVALVSVTVVVGWTVVVAPAAVLESVLELLEPQAASVSAARAAATAIARLADATRERVP